MYFRLAGLMSQQKYPIFLRILNILRDQYQYLANRPPTPPLTQQQSIDNNLRLMLG